MRKISLFFLLSIAAATSAPLQKYTVAEGFHDPMSIDTKNSTVYWGEVGPDADKPSANGPAGHDEINQARSAGNNRSFTVKPASHPGNVKITVTWWLTTGVTERELGTGSNITVPGDEGSEIRAVASDGKNPVSVARLSLINEKAMPELRLILAGNPGFVAFSQSLASKPGNAGDGGAWEFTAEAPGFTAAKFRIPAK